MKKKITKKVIKPYNAGTMTSAAFFQWLRQILRKASIYWKPVAQVRNEAKVPYEGINKRRKFSYICSKCNREFAGKDVKVHHIVECGTLTSFEDLPNFVKNLFVEKEGLILVCNKCHDKLHNK